jgi:limonene-1,2-epoxide hydrolase
VPSGRHSVTMDSSPESVVRNFLGYWTEPDAARLASFLADDAVWIDGPNGVHRGRSAVVEELVRQLTVPSESWMEIDTLLAGDGTVMVEWHGGLKIGAAAVATRVMAVFEVDRSGRITEMRESFDMQSLLDQIASGGVEVPK